jgi:hypothetical protein
MDEVKTWLIITSIYVPQRGKARHRNVHFEASTDTNLSEPEGQKEEEEGEVKMKMKRRKEAVSKI